MSDTAPNDNLDLGEAVLLTGIVMSPGTNHASGQLPDAGETVISRMASATVRRKCNQHACERPISGSCAHPNHRRDADYLSFILGTLGLPQTHSPVTDEDRSNLLDVIGNQSVAGIFGESSED